MALHRLTQIVMGVPNPEEAAAYYTDFVLTPRTAEEGSVLWLPPSLQSAPGNAAAGAKLRGVFGANAGHSTRHGTSNSRIRER